MPPLQVKDCPEDIYEALRAYAASENRSISQQTLTIIQDRLRMRPSAETHMRPLDSTGATEPPSGERKGEPYPGRHEGPSRTIYSAHQDETDYVSRRQRALSKLDEFPPLALPKEFATTVDLVHAAREERW